MTERPNKRQRSESYGERSNLAGKAPTAKLYVQSIHIYSYAIYSNCYFRKYTSFKTSAFSPVLKRRIALFFAIPLSLHSYTSSSFTTSRDYHVAHPRLQQLPLAVYALKRHSDILPTLARPRHILQHFIRTTDLIQDARTALHPSSHNSDKTQSTCASTSINPPTARDLRRWLHGESDAR